MKLSWKNFKISIAGAKLGHLVLKDKAWDPGSMTEQARNIFRLVQKANNSGHIDILKKHLTDSCFQQLANELDLLKKNNRAWETLDWEVSEIAILEVHPGKGKKPDGFVAYIKVFLKADNMKTVADRLSHYYCNLYWTFENQAGWWKLSEMKGGVIPEKKLIKY